ncbi:hypothetical protein F5144DRAFT_23577 [Chaetomium tenue]|uniref:Uncharacterized protein n=1 Tax=Chaetomium tenue TaxID=1854479 RepID=A0ACB7PQE1_9PEZI|nr:hypothetical protein F5144DRAFT_23577 [Chaetomium globosum]
MKNLSGTMRWAWREQKRRTIGGSSKVGDRKLLPSLPILQRVRAEPIATVRWWGDLAVRESGTCGQKKSNSNGARKSRKEKEVEKTKKKKEAKENRVTEINKKETESNKSRFWAFEWHSCRRHLHLELGFFCPWDGMEDDVWALTTFHWLRAGAAPSGLRPSSAPSTLYDREPLHCSRRAPSLQHVATLDLGTSHL